MPEIVREILDVVNGALIRKGIAPPIAREAAEESAEHVRQHFGGQILYIPKGRSYELARRNEEIRRRLAAGENHDVIRRELGLSDMQLRRIEADDAPGQR